MTGSEQISLRTALRIARPSVLSQIADGTKPLTKIKASASVANFVTSEGNYKEGKELTFASLPRDEKEQLDAALAKRNNSLSPRLLGKSRAGQSRQSRAALPRGGSTSSLPTSTSWLTATPDVGDRISIAHSHASSALSNTASLQPSVPLNYVASSSSRFLSSPSSAFAPYKPPPPQDPRRQLPGSTTTQGSMSASRSSRSSHLPESSLTGSQLLNPSLSQFREPPPLHTPSQGSPTPSGRTEIPIGPEQPSDRSVAPRTSTRSTPATFRLFGFDFTKP
jgi:hypothetical protein